MFSNPLVSSLSKRERQYNAIDNDDAIAIKTGREEGVWNDEGDDDVDIDINHVNRLKKLKSHPSFQQDRSTNVTGRELSTLLKDRYVHSFLI